MSFSPPSAVELEDFRQFATNERWQGVNGPDSREESRMRRRAEVALVLYSFFCDGNAADEFQKKCLRTVKSEPGDATLTLCALGLGGETGEVIEPVKKHLFHGKPLSAQHVMEELGDVLWYAAVMAHELGFPLSAVMQHNVRKLEARHFEKTGKKLTP